MLLQDLTMGENLTLEVLWGEFHYDIAAKVEYVRENGILITAFTYGGKTIDFNRPEFKGAIIDVYANDREGKRYCWKDVAIEIKHLFGKDFYQVRTNEFKKFGLESERRQNTRILLNTNCTAKIEGKEEVYHVVLYDISSNGLAFLTDEELNPGGGLISVEFSDVVRDHNFELHLECRFVRKTKKQNQSLYACRISNANKEAFAYLYLKTADAQAKAKPKSGESEENNSEVPQNRISSKPHNEPENIEDVLEKKAEE